MSLGQIVKFFSSLGVATDVSPTNRLPVDSGAGSAGVPSGGVQSVQEVGALLTAVQSANPVQTYIANSYVNITTKTTTVVKGSPGTLAKLIVNKLGSSDTIAIYDNTAGSGTLVGTFTSPGVGSYSIDAAMGTGITVVTGGTTAGDYTIIYR